MVGMLTDVGNIRSINEDFIGAFHDDKKNMSIYAIADGMGGHNAGEVASKIAVETIISYIKLQKNVECMKDMLLNGIQIANKKIYRLSKQDNKLMGMGTTITTCLIKENEMLVANVGDSRCYAIKDNSLVKITRDHSLVQQLVDSGNITEEEALIHPNKNIITRALGTKEFVEIDVFKVDLNNVYKIILCTDGLTNEVTNDEIFDIIMNNDNKSSCKQLVELSKSKGGRDNISVIVFEGECQDARKFTRE